jgi:hypothetical protein
MRLFSDPFVEKIRAMPDECSSFLGELCSPSAERVRSLLDKALTSLRPELATGISARMSSLDNRRFFQGFAELATAQVLEQAGWDVQVGDGQHAALRVSRNGGVPVNVMVLAFIQPHDPQMDPATIERLRQALARVRSDLRFSVFVRRWLPTGFNPEPVRQAVDLWLQEVEAGRWEGHFAGYEDAGVSLEFSLSGERADESQSPVVMVLGPFLTGRSVQRLEHSLVRRLDRYRMSSFGNQPLLVATVANRPWALSRGYVREFLYGKPRWVATDKAAKVPWKACLSLERDPCVFKDEHYQTVAGLLMLERDPLQAAGLQGRAYANPFAEHVLQVDDLPFPVLAESSREEDGAVVLSWHQN